MGYEIEDGTLKWAKTRVQQLTEAEISIGCAIERLESVPTDLRDGALLMDDQPDSEVMRSYANDVEKLHKDLKKTFDDMVKDRKAIQKGIRKYKEARHDWSV
ncbi:MAG: hypothetical protein J6Y95_05605 [Lachnospiraceae bacterium]|nr:hypothetical protein [Lachnospiraceae bacterium]